MPYITVDVSKSDMFEELETSDLIAELQERESLPDFLKDLFVMDGNHIDLIDELECDFRRKQKYPEAIRLQEVKEALKTLLER